MDEGRGKVDMGDAANNAANAASVPIENFSAVAPADPDPSRQNALEFSV